MGSNNSETFTFSKLPQNVAELKALPEYSMDSAYKTAALTLLALMKFESDENECFAMLDALRGPDPMSGMAKQFIKERLSGKTYKVRSFFAGTSVENNYTPAQPYSVTVSANPYSFDEENWATLYVKSSGADSPRPLKFRKKPSTGQWFLNDIVILADIRTPAAEDPWA